MNTARRRLPFGAETVDAERTRFRLWAPDAERVDVVMRHAHHRRPECREPWCGLGESVGLDGATLGERLGKEVQHHLPFLQSLGQVELKGLSADGGRGAEGRRDGARLQGRPGR